MRRFGRSKDVERMREEGITSLAQFYTSRLKYDPDLFARFAREIHAEIEARSQSEIVEMAELLKIKPTQMHVLTGNVGGSFGMKGSPYPEYAGLFHASKLLGRPVKWTDDRSGSFLSDQHGRDHDFEGELALDKDGNFLAVRLTGFANVGGYLANVGPLMGSMGVTRNLAAIYRTPLIEVASRVMFTNTSPVGAYRGAGRPEANYFMERLIEAATSQQHSRRVILDFVDDYRNMHFTNEEFVKLVGEAAFELDDAKRADLFTQADAILEAEV